MVALNSNSVKITVNPLPAALVIAIQVYVQSINIYWGQTAVTAALIHGQVARLGLHLHKLSFRFANCQQLLML